MIVKVVAVCVDKREHTKNDPSNGYGFTFEVKHGIDGVIKERSRITFGSVDMGTCADIKQGVEYELSLSVTRVHRDQASAA